MTPKILSLSGQSLADMYDVEGSIAGIDQLETRELPIVHEMGATVMSERFTTRVFRIPSGPVNQSTGFVTVLTTLPETPARLLGVQVISSLASRLERVAVLGTDPRLSQDFPLWVMDTAAVVGETVAMEDAGAPVTIEVVNPRPAMNQFPSFVGGREQQDSMVSSITLVGSTTAFGAGTVTTTALLLLAFPRRDGSVSSKGVPIPSW